MENQKIGLVVNPIAGMGGKVGLKGTDNPEILEKAREKGAEPVAPERAQEALEKLKSSSVSPRVLTCSDEMGEEESKNIGINYEVVFEIDSGNTTSEDTRKAVEKFKEEGVEIILFAGGDGTAHDVLQVVDQDIPILGIPTGVKMHSAVFANTPKIGGKLLARFLRGGEVSLRDAEVVDVDEEAFRENELSTDLKGYALTPYDPKWVQAAKSPSLTSGSEAEDKKSIAEWVVHKMEEDRLYILGPGTTTRAVAEELGLDDTTLLGVDLIKNGRLVGKDVSENEILHFLSDEIESSIIVSPIGRQGFVFGRGNQQISPEVIRKVGIENVLVIATPNKLANTPQLKVDTGDPDLDDEFRGYGRVILGYDVKRPIPVA